MGGGGTHLTQHHSTREAVETVRSSKVRRGDDHMASRPVRKSVAAAGGTHERAMARGANAP
eukprot:2106837-Prymnesium_polylepis.1